MSAYDDVLRDLAEETAALDRLLDDLSDDEWLRPTPAEGWDVRDTVTHLADTDDIAYDCVVGGPRNLMDEAYEAGGGDDFTHAQVLKGRGMSPDEVLAWWRTSSSRLHEALSGCDPKDRLPWGPNEISAVSFATARLMETWAHGLDCFAGAGREPTDTDRLRHVAFLGLRALPHAMQVAGAEPPGPVRLELTSPSGDTWTFGPDDAPTVIRGTASDWCRVAVQRDRSDERSRLSGEGPGAEAVLANARAYL